MQSERRSSWPACLIAALGPISGAHLNPAVSFVDALGGGLPWRDVPAYPTAQLLGALVGVAAANAMFGLPRFFASHHARSGPPTPGFIAAQFLGAICATLLFGWLVPAKDVASTRSLSRMMASPMPSYGALGFQFKRKGKMKRKVLFICVQNSARSQMAEAFLNGCLSRRVRGGECRARSRCAQSPRRRCHAGNRPRCLC